MLIYKITNLINNKCYIGLTTKSTFRARYNYRDDLQGNVLKIYDGLIHTKDDGFNPSQVSLCCKHPFRYRTHRNLKWEYV